MDNASHQKIEKTFDPMMILTTEMTLESRRAKMQEQNKLFIRVSTQFLGGRFDTKI